MIVMPANNLTGLIHYLAGAYPGKIGMLISPRGGWKKPPFYLPYAIDNGAFTGFDEKSFRDLLTKPYFLTNQPLFVAVPDKLADPETTLKLWHIWHDQIPYKKAFVAQDGHMPQDVPKKADAVFVGGTTEWKIKNAHIFKGLTNWLHIGRVSTPNRLQWAAELGADSCDGTGFFRSARRKLDLIEFITGYGQQKIKF